MIKIHAGKYKNRSISRVNVATTRETASMVREAVFNMLYQISGKALDLFAGSGSYGITALSLGASNVTFIDSNLQATKVITSNLKKLDETNYQVFNIDYLQYIKNSTEKFDLIFLDPPYHFNDYFELLNMIIALTNMNARIVLEVDKKTMEVESFSNFKLIKNKTYGIKKILIYEKVS